MTAGAASSRPPDLAAVCLRVREKSASYDRYNFSSRFNDFLKAFFDLAQEFDSLEDFYRICVAVPLEMTDLSSALYLIDPEDKELRLVCDSEQGVLSGGETMENGVHLADIPYTAGESYVVPVCSRQPGTDSSEPDEETGQRRTSLWNNGTGGFDGRGHILGMFAVGPLDRLDESDRFFFVKYAGRIGFNLANRLIARQNINHLKFINSLVMDIEHNVIVPNMYFLHLFNQLKKKIDELSRLEKEIAALQVDDDRKSRVSGHCREIGDDLLRYHGELVKHHANISLFLESLFRREHFEKGHLVLRPRSCFVEKEIILPQLEHYASRIRSAGITVEHPKNMIDTEFQIMVDVGLLAQVYANLFSNAAKYTREVCTESGACRKAMAYGCEIVDNFPEPGRQGIKFNVFSTGPTFSPEEGEQLFREGRRGPDCAHIPGTGHGLSFIRHVIELHGGAAGYEPTAEGNNFYFILPAPPTINSNPA
jgi:signal transduction histidine kinase